VLGKDFIFGFEETILFKNIFFFKNNSRYEYYPKNAGLNPWEWTYDDTTD